MVGLIDCNNFFVSCERVFRPGLRDKPVVILSNNDGCAVAISNEAKALGIRRGQPFFQFNRMVDTHGVIAFSGNHRLYGDMSSRVMATLNAMLDHVEVYSIDEAFIDLPESLGDLAEYGHYLTTKILHDTGIPVSLGIASTKTLAKIGAHFAKRYPGYRSVCMIDTPEKIRKALSLTPVDDVWGIGRRQSARLRRYGITTALALADMPEDSVKHLFNITGQRTWRELNGEPCIEYVDTPAERQTLTCSRSFASDIHDLDALTEAIAGFSANVGRRLRRQHCCATSLSVFVATNRFHEHEAQYFNCASISLPEPADDDLSLTKAAMQALKTIYREGYGYKKAGVTLTRIVSRSHRQLSIFSDIDSIERRSSLMHTIDRINATATSGHHLVHLASAGHGIGDKVRCEHQSRSFTTSLPDIIRVKA